jgi:hypothetical protein
MIISVHLPKTAGTSFARALEGHFGHRLLRDYGDLPLHRRPLARTLSAVAHGLRHLGHVDLSVECIHGHFLPAKYRLVALRRPASFVTWLRDPVDRLASHYHFWRRSYEPGTAGPLHRRVVEEGWSFERFGLSAELRNTYAQLLWGFPLSRFAFVGITERYEDDFRRFTHAFLGTDLPIHRELVNGDRDAGGYAIDPLLRAKIEAYHARDVRLYRSALASRFSPETLSPGRGPSPDRFGDPRGAGDG